MAITKAKNTEEDKKSSGKKNTKKSQNNTLNVIIGIGLLLAVMSIIYSSTIIVLGTEGIVPLVLIAPQVILALFILVKQFTK